MNIKTNKEIASIFRKIADKIEKGECALDAESLTSAANMLIHIKLYSEDMCKYLNCSRSSLTRMITDLRIPRPHKDAGDKPYWYQDEVDDYIKSRK